MLQCSSKLTFQALNEFSLNWSFRSTYLQVSKSPTPLDWPRPQNTVYKFPNHWLNVPFNWHCWNTSKLTECFLDWPRPSWAAASSSCQRLRSRSSLLSFQNRNDPKRNRHPANNMYRSTMAAIQHNILIKIMGSIPI